MNKKLLFTAIILTSLIYSQQIIAQWGVKGNGNVTKSNRQISGITNVTVESGIDLYIATGDDKENCTVEADENLHNIIMTKVSGNKLSIYLLKSVNRAKSLKVHLYLNKITELTARQGSDIKSTGSLKFDKLNLVCTSGSDAELALNGNELVCECRSGSDIELSGTIKTLRINVSGGSDIEAFKLKALNVYVHASSGSDAKVYTEGELFVRAGSGSDVDYKGKPEHIDVELSSGADLGHD